MFEKIETEYKRKTAFNIFKKYAYLGYPIIVLIYLLIYKFFGAGYAIISFVILFVILVMFLRIKNDKLLRGTSFKDDEYLTMKKYIIRNNLYNIKIVSQLVDYFQYKVITSKKSDLLNIVSFIVSLIPIFFNDNLEFVIELTIVTLFICIVISMYKTVFISFKGEERIYENLHLIFSEMLIEMNTKNNYKRNKKQKSVKY